MPIKVFWAVLAALFLIFHLLFFIEGRRLNANGAWKKRKLSSSSKTPEHVQHAKDE
jgi:hypothetical protein